MLEEAVSFDVEGPSVEQQGPDTQGCGVGLEIGHEGRADTASALARIYADFMEVQNLIRASEHIRTAPVSAGNGVPDAGTRAYGDTDSILHVGEYALVVRAGVDI